MVNYYKIEVYVPYDGSKEIIVSHEEYFDDLEFHSIIQDVIDETILDHIERSSDDEYYCGMNYWELFGSYNRYRFGLFLSRKGFEVIQPTETISIKDRPILSDERYRNIKIDKCEDCYKQEYIDKYDDEKCPVVCKRSDNDE